MLSPAPSASGRHCRIVGMRAVRWWLCCTGLACWAAVLAGFCLIMSRSFLSRCVFGFWHRSLHVIFSHRPYSIFDAEDLLFGDQNIDLAGLDPPLWHLCAPLDDPGARGITREKTLASRLRFSLAILGGFRTPF